MTLPDLRHSTRDEARGTDFVARSDERLLAERVRAGDPVAFEAIFRRYYRELRAAAQRIAGSQATAEDVVQEVFLAVWASRERWHVTTSLGAYLHRCVRNAARRRASSAAMRRHDPLTVADGGAEREPGAGIAARAAVLVDPGLSPIDCAEQALIAERVTRAVASLPPRAREVFVLSRHEHLSNREIAERLALSPKTVEMHLTRALAALRVTLARLRTG